MRCSNHRLGLVITLSFAGACADPLELTSEPAPDAGDAGAVSFGVAESPGGPQLYDGGTAPVVPARADASTARDAAPDTGCPAGPVAPLGTPCAAPGLVCTYGYDVPGCGGRTVACSADVWSEQSHTDPTSTSCSPSGGWVEGEPCRYDLVPGVARISAVSDAGVQDDCDVPQSAVRFDFRSLDGGVAPDGGELLIAGSRRPATSCLAAEGLTLGAELPVTFKRQTAGNCTARVFDFARTFPACVSACGD